MDIAAEATAPLQAELEASMAEIARLRGDLAEARAKAFEEAAQEAYLACMRAAKKPHRTSTLGLARGTYDFEYAQEARDALRSLIPKDKQP